MKIFPEIFNTIVDRREYLYELLIQHIVLSIGAVGIILIIGLGQSIYRGINTNNSSLIIAGSVSVALLALVADWIIGFFESFSKPGADKATWHKRIVKYSIFFILFGLLILAIFSNPRRSSRNEIVVATKPTAEQYILGEIVSQLIENRTDIRVKRRFGIGGGTSNIHPAIMAGEVDVYPEYTGTAWLFVLKEPQINNPDSLYDALRKAYAEKYNLEWTGRFNEPG